MAWNDSLTGRSLEIASSNSASIRIVAGPGTGKTFSLKKRISRLLEEGADPYKILVVTFTRVAARELINELHTIGIDGCLKLNIGTIHSFCFNMLLSKEVLHILTRVPRPLIYFQKSGVLQFEGKAMLFDISHDDFGNKRDCTRRIKAFEAAWARLQSEEPGWPNNNVDRAFQEALLNWLTFHQSILIGELIPLSLNFLRNNPLGFDRNMFEHIIVDEYQDLNKAEQVLIDLLAEKCNIFVVGDANQSIYSFRHAHPEGINEYHLRHVETLDLPLIECRRCPKGIVRLANSLIKNNFRIPQDIILNEYPDNIEGTIHMVQWIDNISEANGLVEFINNLVIEKGFKPEDFLVLCPRRELGTTIRNSLISKGINSHSFYHEEILDDLEIQIAFSIMTLLINRQDRVALRFYLGCKSESFLTRQYRILMHFCIDNDISPFDALTEIIFGKIQLKGVKDLVSRFNELIALLKSVEHASGKEIFNKLFPGNISNCELVRAIVNSEIDLDSSFEITEVHRILTTYISQPDVPIDINYVRIMSLHKSKGLSSRVVIITSCIEGLIPTLDNELGFRERILMLKEQRRLLYVGVTRSKEILVLSSFANIDRGFAFKMGARLRGWGTRTISSRFLGEFGPTSPRMLDGTEWQW